MFKNVPLDTGKKLNYISYDIEYFNNSWRYPDSFLL